MIRPRHGRLGQSALIGAAVLLLHGCALLDGTPHSRILTGPDGMRTFTWVTELGGTPLLCPAFGLNDPVHGTLTGGVGEREPAWLETEDGRLLSVIWPAGFGVRFEPTATLYNDGGDRVAQKGDQVELSQTTWDSAAGTFEDPYLASGLVFNGCYPFLK
jgi:hypothetical protein